MQQQQQELWSAEPHAIPLVYQRLTPEQRDRLVSHLAQLMVKQVQTAPSKPPPDNLIENHDR